MKDKAFICSNLQCIEKQKTMIHNENFKVSDLGF